MQAPLDLLHLQGDNQLSESLGMGATHARRVIIIDCACTCTHTVGEVFLLRFPLANNIMFTPGGILNHAVIICTYIVRGGGFHYVRPPCKTRLLGGDLKNTLINYYVCVWRGKEGLLATTQYYIVYDNLRDLANFGTPLVPVPL